jgi:hypothetical protein
MAALIVLTATIVAIAVVLFGVFVWTCVGIRRTDKFGIRRPGLRARRRVPSLAYVARWDDNRPAFA